MGRRKKLINNTNIPQHTIESIARRLLPDIMAYYQSEEDQREFIEWKANKKNGGHPKTTIAASPFNNTNMAQRAVNAL